MGRSERAAARWGVALAAVSAGLLAAGAFGAQSAAAAAAPPPLWKKCETGSGAGQCIIPRGIAADPNAPGSVYVADQNNHRVDEFNAFGEFVKAWGWDVDATTPGSGFEVCSAESGDVCQAGSVGGGAGQFGEAPEGVAVDSSGDVYVVDESNLRVEKFDPTAGPEEKGVEFLRMWGKGVNSGSSGNPDLCTNAGPPTDICGAGSEGTGDGQFSEWPAVGVGSYIAAGPGDTIYVGDKERIQEFNPSGEFTGKIEGGALSGKNVQSLAVDEEGNPYVAFSKDFTHSEKGVLKLNPATGAEVCKMQGGEAAAENPRAIATDGSGHVYVFDQEEEGVEHPLRHPRIRQFEASGCAESGQPFGEGEVKESTGLAVGEACLAKGANFYVSNSEQFNSFVRAYGEAADDPECTTAPGPPEIDDQYAVSVDSNGAELKAAINPRFEADTRYFVQYGTAECSEGGCTEEQPAAPGSLLSAKKVGEPLTSAGVFLGGLAPHTTYHYRFVAESGANQGEPVRGVGGKVGEDGAEGTFTTSQAIAPERCPNEAFRTGFSAALPDCRAYEMVSPVDKGNGSTIVLCAVSCSAAAGFDESALKGEGLTYSSYRAFSGAESSPFSVQYIANRSREGGWVSTPISPPASNVPINGGVTGLDTPFKVFTPNLCQSWLSYLAEPPLDPLAAPGHYNLYRRDRCGEAVGYEALIRGERDTESAPELQGISTDGSCAVFRVADQLTPDAAPPALPKQQIYEDCGGALQLVSVLPEGEPSKLENSAGTTTQTGFDNGREHTVDHATSADGSRVYWTAKAGPGGPPSQGLGTLYLRENADQPPTASGECSEAEPSAACTIKVSAGSTAQFWTADEEGDKAIYSEGPDLYEFDAEGEPPASHLIAHEFIGLAGASEDASRLYLVSREELDNGATKGSPNLYLEEGGTFSFIATLSSVDVSGELSPIAASPRKHTAQVSPDGGQIAFMSNSKELSELTAGYDNTDLNNGRADAEVYLYDADAGEGRLICASCNPTGARPAGGLYLLGKEELASLQAAASIPTWETSLYDPRVLSANGRRLFFDSFEALVPEDTNGVEDVYEWEAAGEGGCSEEEGNFNPTSGGCLRLISSGQSPSASEFIDADETGTDAFFETSASLLPQDPGLVDIYDARVGGGFPPPPAPPAPCEGEACQHPSAPPAEVTPSSSSYVGPGNETPHRKKAKKHKKKKAKHHHGGAHGRSTGR
jgi:NHL repeat-containing protein